MLNNFRKFQAILFDMDGVLFLSTDCHERAYREVLQTVGIKYFSYAAIAGMRTDEAIKKILLENHQVVTSDVVRELTTKKRRRALALLDQEGRVAEGSKELVCNLRKKYRLILASSASCQTVDLFLKKSGYAQAFEFVLDGSMVERAKPAPDIYALAVKKLGITPEDCVVIEDAGSGIQAAQAAGIAVIAIVPKNRQDEFVRFNPAMVLSNVNELTVLL